MHKQTFVVADDSKFMAKALTNMLVSMGHEVVAVCENGLDAFEACRNLHPDFITMDITMPGLNGLDTLRMILSDVQDAKVIMVTSHAQKEMVIRAIGLGAKGYLLKPIDQNKLHELIESLKDKK